MPNIEIHGLPVQNARDLGRKVFDLFQDKSYLGETVVTVCPTQVFDWKGFDQPFLRLANSCREHTDEILEALRTLEMDIEYLELKAFIPRK